MKMSAAAVLAFAFLLSPLASPALADKGNGNGGHGPEQGAKPHQPDSGRNMPGEHARGPERAAEAHNKQNQDKNGDSSTEGEDEEAGTIGICHATGNGSYVFIRVSEHAHGHLERHVDDIIDVAGPEACPETVAAA